MIRPLTKADVAQILTVEKASFQDPWTENMFLDSFDSNFFFGFVCEEAGEMLGYICGDAIYEDAQLMSVATAPAHRKKGVARELIAAFEKECKKRGAQGCFLEVRVSNIPASTLYQSVGYAPIGLRKRYYQDGEDAIVMQKIL